MHILGINPVILLANALAVAKGAIPASAGEHGGAAAAADTFSNPVLWEDYPDLDVFRVGDVFYYSSSTFAYSPGAPVLRSYDLVNWEAVSHSVPTLDFGPEYNLTNGARAYVRGIWASSLRYSALSDTFYWIGCIQGGQTHIWTAPGGGAVARGDEVTDWEWTGHPPIPTCYYDCGLLVDDDDSGKMYVAYGNTRISVAELSADDLTQVRTQQVYASTGGTIEGSRMYKIKGSYYILVTKPADAEYVLKADNPFGPYQMRTLVSRISGPISGAGFAHQGGIVSTPDDEWYYVAFMDAYPGGRIPVVAPLTWTADGWPELVTDGAGGWGASYPIPVQTEKTVASPVGTDEFQGATLGHDWEWNHNPDNTKWRLEDGLHLQTADVTTDLFAARNTLTHRIIGPKSVGTFRLDMNNMRDGDRAGAVLFRDRSAYVGVWKEGAELSVVVVNGLTLSEGSWQTTGRGVVAARGPVLAAEAAADIWLRIEVDITPAYGSSRERTATFSYSTDGETFTALGPAFPMTNSYRYFTGYRYGVFNHATKELGGEVKVKSFTMQYVD